MPTKTFLSTLPTVESKNGHSTPPEKKVYIHFLANGLTSMEKYAIMNSQKLTNQQWEVIFYESLRYIYGHGL